MKTSPDFQTGGILLMVGTVICAGLAVAVTVPLLHLKPALSADASSSIARTSTSSTPESPFDTAKTAAIDVEDPRFAEFYPDLAEATGELQRVNAMTGPSLQQAHSPASQRSVSATYPSLRTSPSGSGAMDTQSAAHEFVVAQSGDRSVSTTPADSRHESRFGVPVFTDGRESHRPTGMVPSGSVYAPVTVHPVTVHVDGEIFAQQLQAMSERFESLLVEQNRQHQQSLAALAEEERKRTLAVRERQKQRAARPQPVTAAPVPAPVAPVTSVTDEQLSRIENGMQTLSLSFQSLQAETEANLRKMAAHADRAEVANKVIESYDRVLQKRMQQEEQQAGRVRVALIPDQDVSESTPDTPLPQPLTQQPDAEIWKSHSAPTMPAQPAPSTHSRTFESNEQATSLMQTAPDDARSPGTSTISASRTTHTTSQSQPSSGTTSITIPQQPLIFEDAPVPSRPMNQKTDSTKAVDPETTMSPTTGRLHAVPPAAGDVPPRSIVQQSAVGVPGRPIYHFELKDSAPATASCSSPGCSQCPQRQSATQLRTGRCRCVNCRGRMKASTGVAVNAANTATSASLSRRVVPASNQQVVGSVYRRPVSPRPAESEGAAWRVRLPTFPGHQDNVTPDGEKPGLLHRMGSTLKRLGGSDSH
ncbi:MAG: hypothetical protein R3C59_10355 [Planctomycetaceae bacterium]